MPELPEVETVARGLRAALPGRRILSVRLSAKTNFIEDPSALEMHLPGRTVSGIRRHGKLLLVDFEQGAESDSASALSIHLGMTGQIVVSAPEAPVPPHTHVFLALDDGREFRYTDVRRFGKMRLVSAIAAAATRATTLGADSLEITKSKFTELVRSRRSRIKALLLDQGAISGMGNIYTDEALWRARIHPTRHGADLKPDQIARLYAEVRGVLNDAIELKGSSVSDYVDAEGNRGEFQTRHRVYQRTGEPCFRCGAKIRRSIVAGRSSHFCPRCQPVPRVRNPHKKRQTRRISRVVAKRVTARRLKSSHPKTKSKARPAV